MKHLAVVAHPVENSFTMGLTRAYTDELEKLGHTQRTYDLYRMGFNPALNAQELSPANDKHPVCADVAKAQDEIRAADVLAVIYPLWWMSMPAMMKGYIDRVFARGFAYESSHGAVRGLLGGKKAVLITCSGAPLPVLVKSGNWNAVQVLQDTHVLRSTGFELIEHLHFDEIAPELPTDVAAQHMERVRSCVRQHFARG
ncbi:putative NADPH-quinone reductase (modulator of drug activity B) [Burkholderia sp. Ch1-1]|uniref:Putative NADPH-quinone reductase (Modulator of drug activity B) n=1 Tax=Paraburkholderia dioscoreae TaxID=2604047 RepID=A0A5Q4ZGN9_9BURK|nr:MULTISPECIES: NAD(P)H-dependent oxidoreductase [Paraburkholderia]EIF30869.1 putative NADPH-quinone reductase (modulator of drug activity B) [Burkholderia sp. Ch1-1]MDR8401904.1 NAD(P)H-dependent oxidoreductase [Paraburkholderia sp. USG1]VVD28892.1 putative NADPH-quinone reductase (Modulator of drug activity B) [Paraburkholderia dioscoreae]